MDRAAEGWEGRVGVVTTLFPETTIAPVPSVIACVVGPPVMYRFVFAELRALGIPDEHVYFSLERRMKCGVGKCGNCQIEGKSVCVDGPVFPADELTGLRESI